MTNRIAARVIGELVRTSGELARLSEAGRLGSEFQELFAEAMSLFSDLGDYSVSSPTFKGLLRGSGAQTPVSALNETLANAYGAGAAFIGTSGSSGANISLMLALSIMNPGRRKIIVDSSSHVSIYGGLLVAGAEAVVLPRKVCSRTGIPLSNIMGQLTQLLVDVGDDCLAVCVTMPGYVGDLSNLSAMYKLCQKHGALLMVDGAWGAHFGLTQALPPALIQSADFVNLSLHKAGLAPQQVCVTLIKDAELAKEIEAVQILGFASTSPNPILLVVAEHRIKETLQHYDHEAVHSAAAYVRERASAIHPSLRAMKASDLEADYLNLSQVIFDTSDIQMCARRWRFFLSDQFMRDAEMAQPRFLLLNFAPGNIARLDELIADLRSALLLAIAEYETEARGADLVPQASEVRLNVREAVMAPSEWIPVGAAIGRQLSGHVLMYPPGRGLPPGTILSEEICREIASAIEHKFTVYGVSADSDPRLRVTINSVRIGD